MKPDFAVTDVSRLEGGDLKFLIEHFPSPGRDYRELAAVMDSLPSTLDSMLDSDFVVERVLDKRNLLLDVSPFLVFNVLLRCVLPGRRTPIERRVINYIANLLALYVKVDRLYRIRPNDAETYEYIVDIIKRASQADTAEQFSAYAHIGNFALFLTGMFPQWIEHRHRFKRRPVDRKYFEDQGGTNYHQAGMHPLAGRFELKDVFLRLAINFDSYGRALNEMQSRFFDARPGSIADPTPRRHMD